jgi:hypothetical protein
LDLRGHFVKFHAFELILHLFQLAFRAGVPPIRVDFALIAVQPLPFSVHVGTDHPSALFGLHLDTILQELVVGILVPFSTKAVIPHAIFIECGHVLRGFGVESPIGLVDSQRRDETDI